MDLKKEIEELEREHNKFMQTDEYVNFTVLLQDKKYQNIFETIVKLRELKALSNQKQNTLRLCKNAKKRCEAEFGIKGSARFRGIISEEIIGELK